MQKKKPMMTCNQLFLHTFSLVLTPQTMTCINPSSKPSGVSWFPVVLTFLTAFYNTRKTIMEYSTVIIFYPSVEYVCNTEPVFLTLQL